MDYRRRKQTIIVSILALVLILLFAGAYFKWFYQASTCFDGKQNQKEEGVDCGGPCETNCELLTVKTPQVLWAKAVFLKEGVFDLAAEIENVNPNYGLGHLDYSFKVYDKNGQMIIERQGSSFSLPGQKKYIIEANVSLSALPERTELVIKEPQKADWQRLKDGFEKPDIFVQNKQFVHLDSSSQQNLSQVAVAQASGVVKNNSNFDFDKIIVSLLLFDQAKQIVGVNKTEVYTIMAGEERYFAALWFSPLAGEVKSIDILAETNLFSADNFMRRNSGMEKFQEY